MMGPWHPALGVGWDGDPSLRIPLMWVRGTPRQIGDTQVQWDTWVGWGHLSGMGPPWRSPWVGWGVILLHGGTQMGWGHPNRTGAPSEDEGT